MTKIIDQLLENLAQQGVKIRAEGDLLRIRSPRGILTTELETTILTHKAEILVILRERQRAIDLNTEVILDHNIYPQGSLAINNPPQAIFVTGTTGFLGGFLLAQLLQSTSADIYCLVRADSWEMGRQKIQNNLANYELWDDIFTPRIIPIVGDLSLPKLGLDSELFMDLQKKIDCIYHSAALLNWVYPYTSLKSINVLGTESVLRLACQFKVKPVHYISTIAVWESVAYAGKSISETEPLLSYEGITLGYSQSKWVAEKLVQLAGKRGLPVVIYRCPLISGDSKTGAWNTDDIMCRLIKGGIQIGSLAEIDYQLNLAPINYVSEAIIYLSKQPESLDKTFHLINPKSVHWTDLISWIRDFGYSIESLSYQDWLKRLNQIHKSFKTSLYPLLPFLRQRDLEGKLVIPNLYHQQRSPEISCQDTVNVLARSNIVCPPVDRQLLSKYLQSFIKLNFLNEHYNGDIFN